MHSAEDGAVERYGLAGDVLLHLLPLQATCVRDVCGTEALNVTCAIKPWAAIFSFDKTLADDATVKKK